MKNLCALPAILPDLRTWAMCLIHYAYYCTVSATIRTFDTFRPASDPSAPPAIFARNFFAFSCGGALLRVRHLLQRDVNDSSTKTGMLFLVDLAGSEMVKKTHATGQVRGFEVFGEACW